MDFCMVYTQAVRCDTIVLVFPRIFCALQLTFSVCHIHRVSKDKRRDAWRLRTKSKRYHF